MATMEVGNLQNEAARRKERLKALKSRSNTHQNDIPSKRQHIEEAEKLPKPVFRSYRPTDESLKDSQLEKSIPAEVSEQVQDQLELGKPEPVVDEIDLTTLAPRKPDWDLKRDIAKKLEKLDRRTQRAIAELIRDRIQAGTEDLGSVAAADIPNSDLEED